MSIDEEAAKRVRERVVAGGRFGRGERASGARNMGLAHLRTGCRLGVCGPRAAPTFTPRRFPMKPFLLALALVAASATSRLATAGVPSPFDSSVDPCLVVC